MSIHQSKLPHGFMHGKEFARDSFEPEYDPSHQWDSEKFGMHQDDIVNDLWDRFNSRVVPIQDHQAFFDDVRELARLSKSREEFENNLRKRRDQRLNEIEQSISQLDLIPDTDTSWNGAPIPVYNVVDGHFDTKSLVWSKEAVSIFRNGCLSAVTRFFSRVHMFASYRLDTMLAAEARDRTPSPPITPPESQDLTPMSPLWSPDSPADSTADFDFMPVPCFNRTQYPDEPDPKVRVYDGPWFAYPEPVEAKDCTRHVSQVEIDSESGHYVRVNKSKRCHFCFYPPFGTRYDEGPKSIPANELHLTPDQLKAREVKSSSVDIPSLVSSSPNPAAEESKDCMLDHELQSTPIKCDDPTTHVPGAAATQPNSLKRKRDSQLASPPLSQSSPPVPNKSPSRCDCSKCDPFIADMSEPEEKRRRKHSQYTRARLESIRELIERP